MALGHAVLAALLEGEASGYELSKRFDVSTANFWPATPQQLYRELDRLEEAGLVSGRVVEQERRPNKRVFELTTAGRAALREFTAVPPRPIAIRDELLVKLQAVDAGDVEAVAAAVAERLEQARGKLALFDRFRDRILAGRSEEDYLARADRVGPYLTLMRGRSFERENVRWCERVLAVLERRGAAVRPPRSPSPAAPSARPPVRRR
jgi:DNA-binding PadR family transcriptional regulator